MEVKELLKEIEEKSIQIIDIREPYEFEDDAILNSENIPMDDIAQNPEMIKGKSIFVCQTGKRAESLCYILKEMHQLNNVHFLEGGYEAYVEKTRVH
ncbi:MAG: rhodanese-like domain-containing protein [Flavobacteriales bacterium]|jgi:rhodanese-related sulfurtransferase|nr:rhodanese-like domain-containing protein [Flavobacteriales bacterium]